MAGASQSGGGFGNWLKSIGGAKPAIGGQLDKLVAARITPDLPFEIGDLSFNTRTETLTVSSHGGSISFLLPQTNAANTVHISAKDGLETITNRLPYEQGEDYYKRYPWLQFDSPKVLIEQSGQFAALLGGSRGFKAISLTRIDPEYSISPLILISTPESTLSGEAAFAKSATFVAYTFWLQDGIQGFRVQSLTTADPRGNGIAMPITIHSTPWQPSKIDINFEDSLIGSVTLHPHSIKSMVMVHPIRIQTRLDSSYRPDRPEALVKLEFDSFVHALKFSPTANLMAVAGGYSSPYEEYHLQMSVGQGFLNIYELKSSPLGISSKKKVILKPSSSCATVTAVSFSPDGKYLAYGRDDGSVKIIDVKNGAEVGSGLQMKRPVTALQYNTTGDLIAVASLDEVVLLGKLPPSQSKFDMATERFPTRRPGLNI